ncbi:MAG: MmcQ/YjbR family DNA-binding protein [Phenylobacterium sp.]|uniref:MmcQ/YjbR family DNA-binding protein n=1 Tax=Phenylobacterium sp. TaxID=1871053 RepID=UPI002719C20D|nr:MmcQ/YjbR family DNA-binding protein [Phenylobacterium sp.]MDO8901372.1 MmcQ/YjbR family DNA-binding protein [Phenylobacterium sp.]
MSPQATLALSLPATTHSVQWGGEHVFKVGGKMFAVLGSGGGLSFKASDIAFEALIESGRARPAPYLARAKWVRFDDLTALDPDETTAWLSAAHGLVAARLTRAQKREHGLT